MMRGGEGATRGRGEERRGEGRRGNRAKSQWAKLQSQRAPRVSAALLPASPRRPSPHSLPHLFIVSIYLTTLPMSWSESRFRQAGIEVFRIPCFTIQNISASLYPDPRPGN